MKTVNFQFKPWSAIAPLTAALVLSPYIGLALDVKDVPNPQQINKTWVTDMAEILSPQTESELNQIISELERKNGVEMAVVTVPETAPAASPKEFTTTLFNYWGIGKKNENNGVLFLISRSDRRVEIETGSGLESILPDALVGNIISQEIIPRFKQGDYDGGTIAGTQKLVVNLQPTNPQASLDPVQPSSAEIPWYIWLGGAASVTVLLGAILGRPRKKASSPRKKASSGVTSASSSPNNTSHQSSSPKKTSTASHKSSHPVSIDYSSSSSSDSSSSYDSGSGSSSYGGGSSDGGGAGGSW